MSVTPRCTCWGLLQTCSSMSSSGQKPSGSSTEGTLQVHLGQAGALPSCCRRAQLLVLVPRSRSSQDISFDFSQMDLVDLVLWEPPPVTQNLRCWSPRLSLKGKGLWGGMGQQEDSQGTPAKEKHWFGSGKTPCPVQAQNICLICFLKLKEQEAQPLSL